MKNDAPLSKTSQMPLPALALLRHSLHLPWRSILQKLAGRPFRPLPTLSNCRLRTNCQASSCSNLWQCCKKRVDFSMRRMLCAGPRCFQNPQNGDQSRSYLGRSKLRPMRQPDRRASVKFCFPENRQAEPQGSCNRSSAWTAPRKGRWAKCCSAAPLGGGSGSGLGFGAPVFLVTHEFASS